MYCTAQTIMKKASAMLDGNSSIHRVHRLYYAYLSNTSAGANNQTAATAGAAGGGAGGAGGVTNAAATNSMEHYFGRPMVVARLGQFIMDIKVRTHSLYPYCGIVTQL